MRQYDQPNDKCTLGVTVLENFVTLSLRMSHRQYSPACKPFGADQQNDCAAKLNRNNPRLAAAKCKAVNAIHYRAPKQLEGVRIGRN